MKKKHVEPVMIEVSNPIELFKKAFMDQDAAMRH